MQKKARFGFTLIELLIVIAVMAILTTVVFVALNPLARFQDARNSRRWTDVNTILQAIKLRQVDNGGIYPPEITDLTDSLYYQIGTGASCNESCLNPTVSLESDCVDLSNIARAGYMPDVPRDPNMEGTSEEHTKYYLVKNTNGSISIGSCGEELGSAATVPNISVTR